MDEQNLQIDLMIATSERFQSLESKINHLTIDLDKKNIALNDLNFHNQNLIKGMSILLSNEFILKFYFQTNRKQ